MADLSQVIRWNTNFVRGLAESVLSRAKVIRSGLKPKTASKAKRTIKKATAKTRSKSRRG